MAELFNHFFDALFPGNDELDDDHEHFPPDTDEIQTLEARIREEIGHASEEHDPVQITQVPTVFTWTHGGRRVYLISSVDGWEERHRMHRSQNDFTQILELPAGRTVQYRFEVDGRLLVDHDQRHVRSVVDGGYVNEIFVEAPSANESFLEQLEEHGTYSQEMPHPDDYVREPPHAPPHLGQILLNNQPSRKEASPVMLPPPSHVLINHVYVAERKLKDVIVLGITQRFKEKTFTTVYYKHINSLPKRNAPNYEIPKFYKKKTALTIKFLRG